MLKSDLDLVRYLTSCLRMLSSFFFVFSTRHFYKPFSPDYESCQRCTQRSPHSHLSITTYYRQVTLSDNIPCSPRHDFLYIYAE
jgi:hypothetical protein